MSVEEAIDQVLQKRFGDQDNVYTVSYSYVKDLFKMLMIEVLDQAGYNSSSKGNG